MHLNVQLKAQQHTVTYNSKIDVISVVKDICDLKQICTQSAGLRPFGVSLLIAGIEEDGEPRLYLTEPYGLYFQYRAAIIGEGDVEIEQMLLKRYKQNMSINAGISLAVGSLKEFLGAEFDVERLDVE